MRRKPFLFNSRPEFVKMYHFIIQWFKFIYSVFNDFYWCIFSLPLIFMLQIRVHFSLFYRQSKLWQFHWIFLVIRFRIMYSRFIESFILHYSVMHRQKFSWRHLRCLNQSPLSKVYEIWMRNSYSSLMKI